LAGLKWNGALFLLLLEELHIGDDFDHLVGRPETIPPARYPESVAMAIALRHSWRPDDLADITDSLGLRSGANSLSDRSIRRPKRPAK